MVANSLGLMLGLSQLRSKTIQFQDVIKHIWDTFVWLISFFFFLVSLVSSLIYIGNKRITPKIHGSIALNTWDGYSRNSVSTHLYYKNTDLLTTKWAKQPCIYWLALNGTFWLHRINPWPWLLPVLLGYSLWVLSGHNVKYFIPFQNLQIFLI